MLLGLREVQPVSCCFCINRLHHKCEDSCLCSFRKLLGVTALVLPAGGRERLSGFWSPAQDASDFLPEAFPLKHFTERLSFWSISARKAATSGSTRAAAAAKQPLSITNRIDQSAVWSQTTGSSETWRFYAVPPKQKSHYLIIVLRSSSSGCSTHLTVVGGVWADLLQIIYLWRCWGSIQGRQRSHV